MKNCPKCGDLTVSIVDPSRSDPKAIGLRCQSQCGWELTIADQGREVADLKLLLDRCRWELPWHPGNDDLRRELVLALVGFDRPLKEVPY